MIKRISIDRAIRAFVDQLKESLRNSRLGRRIAAATLRDFYEALHTNFLTTGCSICLREPQGLPELSVIFQLDERAELTVSSLQSFTQSDLTCVEIIYVTTAFSRTTKQLFARFHELKRVEYSDSEGRTDALNRAVTMARGKYILFIQNTLATAPNMIDCALRTMRNLSGNVGVVGGMIIDANGNTHSAGVSIRPSGSFIRYGNGGSPLSPSYQFRRQVHCFIGALLLTRRDLILEVGSLDSTFNLLSLADYCISLWKMGRSVIYEPTLTAVELQIPSKCQAAEDHRAMQLEWPRIVAKHRDWFAEEAYHPMSAAIRARHPSNTKKRVLFIEDRVPHPYLGRGYPRSHLILIKLVEIGYFVTLYPTLEPSEAFGSAYRDIPRDVEILLGPERLGLAQVLRERRRDYDLIFVTRPHNMVLYKDAIGDTQSGGMAKVIYDAEALFSLRDVALMRLDGRLPSEDRIESGIAEEIKLAEGCYSVISVSDSEGAQFSRRGIRRVHTLGHATKVCPTPNGFEQRDDLLFVGALPDASCPNADGLIWFCGEVLPLLQKLLGPNLRLLVAGVNNLQREGPLANDSVIFLGVVPDLDSVYNQAKLFVAPIRFAAGIPVKIYDAAAHGLPVVTTPLLASQLNWQHGDELLAAQSPQAFAHECANLYQDSTLWEHVRTSSLVRMRAECSIESFSVKLQAIMDSALRAGQSVPGANNE